MGVARPSWLVKTSGFVRADLASFAAHVGRHDTILAKIWCAAKLTCSTDDGAVQCFLISPIVGGHW